PRHAAASGGARLFAVVRRQAGGDARVARVGRGRPRLEASLRSSATQRHLAAGAARTRNAVEWAHAGEDDMRDVRLIFSRFIFLLLAVTLSGAARAEYPDRPIRFIVPQAAGSATDTVARILAAELTRELGGAQIVVDDRPGGALTLGL